MPGLHIKDIKDLKVFLSDMAKDKDPYLQERHKVCDLTNKYKDGNSCQRLLDA